MATIYDRTNFEGYKLGAIFPGTKLKLIYKTSTLPPA
jgi:hypothetical protein